jgi:hypothetical protein
MKHRRLSIAAVCVGVALLVGSVVFRVAAVPALERFPLNIDETTHYTGTATTAVDSATLLPLAAPKVEPLSVSRHVKVVDGDYAHAVIQETIIFETGPTKSVEKYQYVMDRRSMKFVKDPRQVAFGDPPARIHPAGSYRVNFAMGTTEHGSYRSYHPAADASVPLVLAEKRHHHHDADIDVIDFATTLEQPVAPYYRDHLETMGLPMQVTAAQLQAQLRVVGIDVDAALADVLPRLTPDESKLLADALTKPIPLQYFFQVDGKVSIDPKTGALVDVHAQREGIAVKPDLSGLASLVPVFAKYSAIPSVDALSTGLLATASRDPQTVLDLQYKQTVPSSVRAAAKAHDAGRRMTLLEWWVPGAMAVLGMVVLVLGVIGWPRAGRRSSGVEQPESPITPHSVPGRARQPV